jgi:hypothetical protein
LFAWKIFIPPQNERSVSKILILTNRDPVVLSYERNQLRARFITQPKHDAVATIPMRVDYVQDVGTYEVAAIVQVVLLVLGSGQQ